MKKWTLPFTGLAHFTNKDKETEPSTFCKIDPPSISQNFKFKQLFRWKWISLEYNRTFNLLHVNGLFLYHLKTSFPGTSGMKWVNHCGHSISTYAKISEKLTFLTHRYTHVSVCVLGGKKWKIFRKFSIHANDS